jgi:hypothetical protein
MIIGIHLPGQGELACVAHSQFLDGSGGPFNTHELRHRGIAQAEVSEQPAVQTWIHDEHVGIAVVVEVAHRRGGLNPGELSGRSERLVRESHAVAGVSEQAVSATASGHIRDDVELPVVVGIRPDALHGETGDVGQFTDLLGACDLEPTVAKVAAHDVVTDRSPAIDEGDEQVEMPVTVVVAPRRAAIVGRACKLDTGSRLDKAGASNKR